MTRSPIPAYRGEFGLKVRFHVPRVYAAGEGHVIEIEEGEEALYPLAKEWRVVPRIPETATRFRFARPDSLLRKLPAAERRFQPTLHIPQSEGLADVDVVICPRRRAYGASKNWPHWSALYRALNDAGLATFAGGVRDGSDPDVPCLAAWDYERPLDATIQAMRSAKLVIASCSGLAHLAVLCGSPLLLFTYHGRVAPGPVINSSGRKVQNDYWPVRLDHYYHHANHMHAPITTLDGWDDPDLVAATARELLAERIDP